jgi:hypothetical protein
MVPVTPEGVGAGTALVAKDESSILAQNPDRTFTFYPLNGGTPRNVPALNDVRALIEWTSDGKGVFTIHGGPLPVEVYRVDLDSGKQTLWKEITPPDVAGIAGLINLLITPDGKSYAYTYRRALSDLYLVPGLK